MIAIAEKHLDPAYWNEYAGLSKRRWAAWRKKYGKTGVDRWLDQNPGRAAGRVVEMPPVYHWMEKDKRGWSTGFSTVQSRAGEDGGLNRYPITRQEWRLLNGYPTLANRCVTRVVWSPESLLDSPSKPSTRTKGRAAAKPTFKPNAARVPTVKSEVEKSYAWYIQYVDAMLAAGLHQQIRPYRELVGVVA